MDKRYDNFKRVAEKRTNKIIEMIQLLGNLSNKSFYDYTDDDVLSIFNVIQKEIDTQKEKLVSGKKSKFKL
ncbi:MAG: hypothetical protein ACVCEJ_03225 [Candidatus Izemoplasmataceae bacterium]